MKNLKYISTAFLSLLLLTACSKIDIDAPKFDVTIDKTTFKVGDTLNFKISGNPYNITFYSGETGNDYDSRGLLTATGGIPQVRFSIALTSTAGNSPSSNMKVLVSNDFNGNYTKNDILAANWIDLSSLVTIPGTNQMIDLTANKVEGKPLYIAFRFQTVDSTRAQRLVTVSNFSFNTVYPNQTYVNADNVYNAGFAGFDFAGNIGRWTIPITNVNNTSFTHNLVAANNPIDDDWAISKAFATNAVLPSTGISFKSVAQDAITEYSHIFNNPGTYKVTFVASNSSSEDVKEVIKQFTITVNP
jgi:plastocyanin